MIHKNVVCTFKKTRDLMFFRTTVIVLKFQSFYSLSSQIKWTLWGLNYQICSLISIANRKYHEHISSSNQSDLGRRRLARLFKQAVSVRNFRIVSEYDQEIPQSQTTKNPVAPRGRAAQPARDTRKTN